MRFTESQIEQIRSIVSLAEHCLKKFYRFTPREWFSYSYEIATRCDFPPDMPARQLSVLAEVTLGATPPRIQSLFPNAESTLYQIMLFDDHILRSLKRLPHIAFEHFLMYILTHELIHIARFNHKVDFDSASSQEKETEETEVHRITRQVLLPCQSAELDQVARLYMSGDYSF